MTRFGRLGLLAVSLLIAPLAVAQPADSPTASAPADPPAEPEAAARPALRYRLAEGHERWDASARSRIVAAMDEAVTLYNQLGTFDKLVTAHFSPGTPTADATYEGWINFGGQINTRVALHEIGHTLGVGTHPRWRDFLTDRAWTGPHAHHQLRAFDGPDAVLHGDPQHFWPYGLNYDREDSDEARRRHVLLVAAFRRDLGIADDAAGAQR